VAHAVDPGAILVTDAISPMGLLPGTYVAGNRRMVVSDRGETYLEGTRTLAGRYGHRFGLCGARHPKSDATCGVLRKEYSPIASHRWTSAYATSGTLLVRPNAIPINRTQYQANLQCVTLNIGLSWGYI